MVLRCTFVNKLFILICIQFLGCILVTQYLLTRREASDEEAPCAALLSIRNASIASTFISTSSVASNERSQYLWCAYHYGPNNQMRDFIKCAILAARYHYTLITSPIFPHHFDSIRGPQWFEQIYDLKALRSVVKTITIDEFIPTVMDLQRNILIDCLIVNKKTFSLEPRFFNRTVVSIENHYQGKIQYRHQINTTETKFTSKLYHIMRNCSSVLLYLEYHAFGQFFDRPSNHTGQIAAHLNRSVSIQRMAQQILHNLPHFMIGNSTPRNTSMKLAVAHVRRGDNPVISIKFFISQMLGFINSTHFTHLYVMCPFLKKSEIAQIHRSLPIPITISKYIWEHARFVMDDFTFDLVEQEIGYQAPIFIGSQWSSYTTTIQLQKIYQKKGSAYLFVRNEQGSKIPFLVNEENSKYY